MRCIRRVTRITLLALCPMPACAQHKSAALPSGGAPLSVEVRVVDVTAVVRNKQGDLVQGLTRDDFLLRQDNQPQTIRYFDQESNLPLTVGLLVDTSFSQQRYAAEERRASATFLKSMITRPQDQAFLMRFDSVVTQLHGLTSNISDLQSALLLLEKPNPASKNMFPHTLLFDAIKAASLDATGNEPGRRAIVVLTDGGDNGSTATFKKAVEAAQSANIAVYGILYLSAGWNNYTGQDTMEEIAQATGGRCFAVTRSSPIELIYAEIQDDLRSQYLLGYTPPSSRPNQYHTIKLKMLEKHLTVQARTGYTSPD